MLASDVSGRAFSKHHARRRTGHDRIRRTATMLGLEREIGGLAVGMRADLVVLDSQLQVERTYVGGELVWNPAQT